MLSFLSLLGFLPSFSKSKCKDLLSTTIERSRLLKCKTERVAFQIRDDIAQLQTRGKMDRAKTLADKLWKELCMLFTYSIISECCHKVRINLSTIAGQRECPMDLQEPIASLCFAASRCPLLPELQDLRAIFSMKYGLRENDTASHKSHTFSANPVLQYLLSKDDPPAHLEDVLLKYVPAQSDEKDSWTKIFLLVIPFGKSNEMNDRKLLPGPRHIKENTQLFQAAGSKALMLNDQGIPTSVYEKFNYIHPSDRRYVGDSPIETERNCSRRAIKMRSRFDDADDNYRVVGKHLFLPDHERSRYGHDLQDAGGRQQSDDESLEGYSNKKLWLVSDGHQQHEDLRSAAACRSGRSCSGGPPRRPPPPLRAPPSIPRASSMPDLADSISDSAHHGHVATSVPPPDYETVAAKVAELSAKALRKESSL